jgi:FkbM family methyltransferase
MPFHPLRTLTKWLRRKPRARQQVTIPLVHLGSEYGGYAVASELVARDSVVYSFGIGEDLSFDLALIERFGCSVHAFDPTPRSLAWAKQQALPDNLHIHAVGLAAHDGVASFSPPSNPNHVSHSLASSKRTDRIEFQVKSLTTLMRELGHERLDILKMDIEGAEYPVVDALARSALRPHQILLEFHHQLPGVSVGRTEHALTTLASIGYKIFNCQPSGHEFSLLHRPDR